MDVVAGAWAGAIATWLQSRVEVEKSTDKNVYRVSASTLTQSQPPVQAMKRPLVAIVSKASNTTDTVLLPSTAVRREIVHRFYNLCIK